MSEFSFSEAPDEPPVPSPPKKAAAGKSLRIVKRIVGVAFALLAIVFALIAFGGSGNEDAAQRVLDSPEASGRMLGNWIPIILFGIIGAWFLFSGKQTK